MVAPSTQRMFLVSVSGFSDYFSTKSGGEKTSETSKSYDGGSTTPDVIASPAEVDNITVSRPFKHYRDADAQRLAFSQVGRLRATIVVTPTDEDLIPIAQGRTYPDALLVRCTEPEVDSSSGDPAVWEMEFAVSNVV